METALLFAAFASPATLDFRAFDSPAAVVKPAATFPAGWRSQRCPFDGTEWWYANDASGGFIAYPCPTCGRR